MKYYCERDELIFDVIFWSTFLHVDRREKAEKVMRWFRNSIEAEVRLIKCEPYHMHPDKPFEVWATTPLGIVHPPDALVETLRVFRPVATGCCIVGPKEFEGGRCAFKGEVTSSHLAAHGISRLSFRISNYD